MTDGVDRCVVGRVGSSNIALLRQVEGRLAQVTELFSNSASNIKKSYSSENGGVCTAVLVDRFIPGDEVVNRVNTFIESDSE